MGVSVVWASDEDGDGGWVEIVIRHWCSNIMEADKLGDKFRKVDRDDETTKR